MSHLLLAITFIFGLCVVDTAAKAQQSTPYESISTAEGLSQGMVFDILQDKEGFIWVATKNGLNRYDGYSFKVFTNDPYNLPQLFGVVGNVQRIHIGEKVQAYMPALGKGVK